MQILFDSRNTCHKDPVGAVPQGTALTLRLSVDEPESVVSVMFVIRHDDREDAVYCQMGPGDEPGTYEISYTVEQAGLYWYWFEVQTDQGGCRIGHGSGGGISLDPEAGSW